MPTWLTRLRPDASAAPGAAPGVAGGGPGGDEPDAVPALRVRLAALVREVDAAGGDLPTEGVVVARQVTDLAAQVLRRDDLGIHARVALAAVVDDYLPTTLRTYLAARRSPDADPGALARTLLDQLGVLRGSLHETVAAVADDDLRALEAQGIFLGARFTGSDL